MPCFCFGITSDCSFGGYNANQIDIKNVDDLTLTDKWGRPSTFSKGKILNDFSILCSTNGCYTHVFSWLKGESFYFEGNRK